VSLTREQIDQLLKPINPVRVLHAQGQAHVSQHDVRAHLTRIFGFGNWSTSIVELRCIRDDVKQNKNGQDVPAVTYLCRLRLTIYDPDGVPITTHEDVGTGTSPNLPDYGDAHDFASKNAASYALKRCAVNLGDQFGLSLYNGGQTKALVGRTLVMPSAQQEPLFRTDVQDGVTQQTHLGDEAPQSDAVARINAAAERLGWETGDIEIDYAREHGGELISNATSEQLTEYAVRLEVSTPDVARAS
jgi:hypothetical protein